VLQLVAGEGDGVLQVQALHREASALDGQRHGGRWHQRQSVLHRKRYAVHYGYRQ
jgi:hypothetical protein